MFTDGVGALLFTLLSTVWPIGNQPVVKAEVGTLLSYTDNNKLYELMNDKKNCGDSYISNIYA